MFHLIFRIAGNKNNEEEKLYKNNQGIHRVYTSAVNHLSFECSAKYDINNTNYSTPVSDTSLKLSSDVNQWWWQYVFPR